jgi:hypothetical protein
VLRHRKPVIVGAIVLSFWAIMTALLINREVLAPGASRAAPRTALPTKPQDVWLGVFVPGERRIGYIHAQSAPEPRNGLPGARMHLTANLQMSLLGETADVQVAGNVWTGLDTSEFQFTVRSGDHDLRAEGRVADGRLTGEVLTAGERMPLDFPMNGNAIFTGGMGGMAGIPAPKPGEEFTISTFDPITLSAAPARVTYAGRDTLTIGGEDVSATIAEVSSSGIASRVWLGDDNEVLRAETPYGLTLARITPEEAHEAPAGNAGGEADLLSAVAIHPTGTKPFRGAQAMRIRIDGVDENTGLPEDEQQRAVSRREYTIEAAPDNVPARAEPEGGVEPHLASDALIQAAHPLIAEQAATIVGAETDPWKKAQAIYNWVYKNIQKKPVASVPSALEVLKTRQGDCNEHTVLYAALARAVGIPTRVAVGIVWSDELDGFYYHAWPEVFVDRWIRIDPTLGQPQADATHIKMATGDILQWARIVPYMGRLKMEVLGIR